MPDTPEQIAIHLRIVIEQCAPLSHIAVPRHMYGSTDIPAEQVQLGFELTHSRAQLLRSITSLESMIAERSVVLSVFSFVFVTFFWGFFEFLLHSDDKDPFWIWDVLFTISSVATLVNIVRCQYAGTELKAILETIRVMVMNGEVIYRKDLEGLRSWYWDCTSWKEPEGIMPDV